MKLEKKILMSFFTIMALTNASVLTADEKVNVLDEVDVIASSEDNIRTEDSSSYTIKSMNTSTKMNLDLIDTPQSISVITNEQIKDFDLDDINKVLDYTPGVTVEKMEADRTQYTSRGFEIKNFLIDGVSLPLNYSYKYGDIDTFAYDRVEVTKGASGLTTIHGDPSGTVNMIRKRPTEEFRGLVKLSGGSWNKRRIDADISGSLTQSDDVTARLIVSKEKSDSYLNRYESDSTLISGIVEAKVSDDSKLSIGLSRYEDKNKGSQWGGIPAFNGIDYDVSTNAASDWSYRDVLTNEAFVEFDSNINDNWKVKTTYLYKNIKQDANLINLWDYSGDLKIDGAQDYDLSSKEHLLDLTLNGNYSLFNKEHKAVFGINYAKRNVKENSLYDRDILGTIIDLQNWDGSTATPVFNDTPNNSKYNEKLLALFFATNYNILDDLSLVAGTRYSNWETKGYGYWNSDKSSKNNGILTPYIGLVYKISDNISTYASYTTSYTPQSEIDKNAVKIDPKEGTTYELGIKSKLFDDKLNTAFSVFKTKQDNVAQWAGRLSDGTNRTYYSVDDGVQTKGFEVELSGALSDSIDVSFGYTQLKVEDANGKDTQTYIPRKTLKALLSYKPHFVKNLKLGTAFKYNSKTSINQWYGSAKQGAYSLVDVFANYKINKNLKLSFNVNNITNKKYYGSLIKPYVTYAAPRNIGASIEYKF